MSIDLAKLPRARLLLIERLLSSIIVARRDPKVAKFQMCSLLWQTVWTSPSPCPDSAGIEAIYVLQDAGSDGGQEGGAAASKILVKALSRVLIERWSRRF